MYVLAAVRTPVALLNGSLCEFSVGQLCAIVFKEALERAVVPLKHIEYLFIGNALDSDISNKIISRNALLKSTKIVTSKCSLESFVNACQFIHQYDQNICLAGGVESVSNNVLFKEGNSFETVLLKLSKNNFMENFLNHINSPTNFSQIQTENRKNVTFYKNDSLYDELAKIIFRKKGQQIIVAEDEQIKSSKLYQKFEINSINLIFPGDGAAAAVIASEKYVKNNLLTPLAKVISFVKEPVSADEYVLSMSESIRKALKIACYDCQNISVWEINGFNLNIVSSIINNLNIKPSLVNKYGGIFHLKQPVGMHGGKTISHIIHSLLPGELGCTAGLTIDGIVSVVILQKMCFKTSEKPHITLYTKKNCQLCNELEKELKPYRNRFSLQKVDIELEENEKFRDLYRYEIPVLFLDGTFLCKHKLDLQHFEWRLRSLALSCSGPGLSIYNFASEAVKKRGTLERLRHQEERRRGQKLNTVI